MSDRKHKGIIFDIDGTLLDSLDIWAKSDEIFLNRLGIAYNNTISKELKSLHYTSASQYLIDKFDLQLSLQEVMDSIYEIVKDEYGYGVRMKPFAKEYVVQEYNKGIKLCAATSNVKSLADLALKSNGVLDMLQFIMTSDDVNCGKESPLIFYKSAEKLGLDKSEIIVFEDSVHAAATAKNAGFFTVGVYDEHSDADFEKLKKVSDITVMSFEELIDKKTERLF